MRRRGGRGRGNVGREGKKDQESPRQTRGQIGDRPSFPQEEVVRGKGPNLDLRGREVSGKPDRRNSVQGAERILEYLWFLSGRSDTCFAPRGEKRGELSRTQEGFEGNEGVCGRTPPSRSPLRNQWTHLDRDKVYSGRSQTFL